MKGVWVAVAHGEEGWTASSGLYVVHSMWKANCNPLLPPYYLPWGDFFTQRPRWALNQHSSVLKFSTLTSRLRCFPPSQNLQEQEVGFVVFVSNAWVPFAFKKNTFALWLKLCVCLCSAGATTIRERPGEGEPASFVSWDRVDSSSQPWGFWKPGKTFQLLTYLQTQC